MSIVEALTERVEQGDRSGVFDVLTAATPQERSSAAKAAAKLLRAKTTLLNAPEGSGRTFVTMGSDQQKAAAWLAAFGTGNGRASGRDLYLGPEPDQLVEETRALRPAQLDDFVRACETVWWRHARALVRAGLIPEPTRRTYVIGILGVVTRRFEELLKVLRADPELLEHHLWKLFEIEGEADLSLGACGEELDHAVRELAATGEIDRMRLLRATLRGLTLGWAKGRQPALVRIHEHLEPTLEERVALQQAYRDVMLVAAPASAKHAMVVLQQVEQAGALDVPATVPALGAVVACPVAGTAKAALKWLGAWAKAHPELHEAIAEAAAQGLLHEKAPVQAAALKVLRMLPAEVAGPHVAPFADAVAPLHQEQVRALIGAVAPSTAPCIEPALDPVAPCAPDRAVAALASLEELALALGRVLEHPEEIDLVEQVFDAMTRLPTARDEAFTTLFDGVRVRARELRRFHGLPGRRPSPLGLLHAVVHTWLTGEIPGSIDGWRRGDHPLWTTGTLWADRVAGLLERIVHPQPRPQLGGPTHQGAWIAAAVLRERLQRWRAHPVNTADAQVALLRVAMAEPEPLPSGASELERALEWTLGGPGPVGGEVPAWWITAARRRGRDHERVNEAFPALRPLPWGEPLPDPIIRWTARNRPDEALPSQMHGPWLVGETSAQPLAWVHGHPSPVRFAEEPRDWFPLWVHDVPVSPRAGRIWAARLAPGDSERFHRQVFPRTFHDRDAWELRHDEHEALTLLVDPTYRFDDAGWWLLAVALSSKHAHVCTRAVDAWIQAIDRGDPVAPALQRAMNTLLTRGAVPGRRLAQTLRSVSQAGVRHASSVVELVLRSLHGDPTHLPRDLSALLELAVELRAGIPDPVATPAGFEVLAATLSRSSKAGRAAQALLAC